MRTGVKKRTEIEGEIKNQVISGEKQRGKNYGVMDILEEGGGRLRKLEWEEH